MYCLIEAKNWYAEDRLKNMVLSFLKKQWHIALDGTAFQIFDDNYFWWKLMLDNVPALQDRCTVRVFTCMQRLCFDLLLQPFFLADPICLLAACG